MFRRLRGTPLAVWSVLRTTAERAVAERVPEAAAGIGFFAVFSFFPLLLILVAVSGILLADTHTQEQVLISVLRLLPVSRQLVAANMHAILNARGTVGVIGIVGLLWSASSAFTVLVNNLNRAWPDAVARGLIRSRLIALALVGSVTGLAMLFLAARASAAIPGNWGWISRIMSDVEAALPFGWRTMLVLPIFGALLLLYRLAPAFRVRWGDAALGAALATAGFNATTLAFTWYLASGLARYNLIYGSLGALVALLVWIYLIALVVLLGAHLSAAVDSVRKQRVSDETLPPEKAEKAEEDV